MNTRTAIIASLATTHNGRRTPRGRYRRSIAGPPNRVRRRAVVTARASNSSSSQQQPEPPRPRSPRRVREKRTLFGPRRDDRTPDDGQTARIGNELNSATTGPPSTSPSSRRFSNALRPLVRRLHTLSAVRVPLTVQSSSVSSPPSVSLASAPSAFFSISFPEPTVPKCYRNHRSAAVAFHRHHRRPDDRRLHGRDIAAEEAHVGRGAAHDAQRGRRRRRRRWRPADADVQAEAVVLAEARPHTRRWQASEAPLRGRRGRRGPAQAVHAAKAVVVEQGARQDAAEDVLSGGAAGQERSPVLQV